MINLLSLSLADAPSVHQPTSVKSINPHEDLISPEHLGSIYRHLVSHHLRPETGLFISFTGTSDRKLSQQGSLYDQAAAGLLFLRLGDTARARAILDYFRQAWDETQFRTGRRQGVRGLANFHNAIFGGEGIEKTIHVGPNAWLGLFAARFANATQEDQYLDLALGVARWMSQNVPHLDGGVAMGPLDDVGGAPWTRVFSTENNISAYAFLSEILRSDRLSPQDRAWIEKERAGLFAWIIQKAYNPVTQAVRRGFNPRGEDNIQALDTYTWLLSAMGYESLAKSGIDGESLLRKAQDLFVVRVNGWLGVDPTDAEESQRMFATGDQKGGVLARPVGEGHRLIWFEGTGQYALAMLGLAERKGYGTRQGQFYSERARTLLVEMDRAALQMTGVTESYPYSQPGKFFHDGWWAPAGVGGHEASSLAGAVWRCFAGLRYDPLSGITYGPPAQRAPLPAVAPPPSTPVVLYGASEEMVVRAWQALSAGTYDVAETQAQATIEEWGDDADRLQHQKLEKVGSLLDYESPTDIERIHSYWALNDVAAAYFILGKVYDGRREFLKAREAFQQILERYSLAQIWDPRGWFWSPVEAIQMEYIARSPRHYGILSSAYLATRRSNSITNARAQ